MKDLTHYFTSPTKVAKENGSTASKQEETTSSVENKSEEIADGDKINVDSEVKIPQELESAKNSEENIVKEKKKGKRGRKSKRKHSDPVVNNISELLSNNLSIISPNTSITEKHTVDESKNSVQNKDETIVKENIVNENKIEATNENNSEQINQENVTKQIKSESKDINTENVNGAVTKKNAFQFMMDSRNKVIGQNSPGKDREDEETDLTEVKEKKEKVEARKNLFTSWAEAKGASKRKREEEEIEITINAKLKKRAKRMKTMLQLKSDKEEKIEKKPRRLRKLSSESETSNDSVENNRKEVPLNDVDGVNSNINNVKEKVDEKDITPKSQKKNRSKLALKTEEKPNRDSIKDKRKSLPLDDIENSQNVKTVRRDKKPHLLNFVGIIDKSKSKKNIVKENTKKEIDENDNTNNKIINLQQKINENSQETSNENFRRSKRKTQNLTIIDESSCESLTSQSIKKWKMKIKMKSDRNKEETIKEENLEEISNDNEDGKKDLCARKPSLVVLTSDSEDEENKEEKCSVEKKNKNSKLAPVFLKSTPKAKLDPEIAKARRQFLMSGIPSSLKKTMEKQKSIEEREFDVFPTIQHVQQKCNHKFWKLSKIDFQLQSISPLKNKVTWDHLGIKPAPINSLKQPCYEKVTKYKTFIETIKRDNPNYPVYKSFRQILEKSSYKKSLKLEEPPLVKKKRGRPKKKVSLDKSIEIIEPPKTEVDIVQHATWPDKYKPKSSNDILGNTSSITKLKNWLIKWMQFSKEIVAKRKRKRRDSNSESEFESTDGDSRDSLVRLPGNTVILCGPHGSGKSSALYAVCEELGFNILELNASSKRTGKKLLQELQEATQSHQVRKGENSISNLFKKNSQNQDKNVEEGGNVNIKKMSIVFVEDVDVVFEQDESFISALQQLVLTSKRPIILSTTDNTSIHVQKFAAQYDVIKFSPISANVLSIWLKILCLVEGFQVDEKMLGMLLDYNNGDARKTILQLQFWLQSGGDYQNNSCKNILLPTENEYRRFSCDSKLQEDISNLSYAEEGENISRYVHSHCLHTFESLENDSHIPFCFSLGKLWWNIPNILGLKTTKERIERFHDEAKEQKENCETAPVIKKKNSEVEQKKLESFSKLYESLAVIDVAYKKCNFVFDSEPEIKNWSYDVKDSLELGELFSEYDASKEFVTEWTHTLINRHIDSFKLIDECNSTLDLSLPSPMEKRWRAKHHACEDILQQGVTGSNIENLPMAIDYFPYMRSIARSEMMRANNNTKRGNRFRHYLKTVGVNFNESTAKIACNILTYDD